MSKKRKAKPRMFAVISIPLQLEREEAWARAEQFERFGNKPNDLFEHFVSFLDGTGCFFLVDGFDQSHDVSPVQVVAGLKLVRAGQFDEGM